MAASETAELLEAAKDRNFDLVLEEREGSSLSVIVESRGIAITSSLYLSGSKSAGSGAGMPKMGGVSGSGFDWRAEHPIRETN